MAPVAQRKAIRDGRTVSTPFAAWAMKLAPPPLPPLAAIGSA
jgi:hypothetical protein